MVRTIMVRRLVISVETRVTTSTTVHYEIKTHLRTWVGSPC
jgi:hypothetical protein